MTPSARTNAKLRREIQQSGESDRALAARLGLNPKAVAKWRSRTTTLEARKGPKRPVSTVLSAADEALIVVFRKYTRLPLDICLAHLKPTIPALSRSALHRCLKRYGVSRIPTGLAEKPPKFELGRQSGSVTIEVCAMPGETGCRDRPNSIRVRQGHERRKRRRRGGLPGRFGQECAGPGLVGRNQ